MIISKTFRDMNLYIVEYTILLKGGLGNSLVMKYNTTNAFTDKDVMLEFAYGLIDSEYYENVKISYAPIMIDRMEVKEYKLDV